MDGGEFKSPRFFTTGKSEFALYYYTQNEVVWAAHAAQTPQTHWYSEPGFSQTTSCRVYLEVCGERPNGSFPKSQRFRKTAVGNGNFFLPTLQLKSNIHAG
jgi:hypothetical protein